MNDTVPSQKPPRSAGMLCPVCKVDLMLSDRQGIEIDYCPQCRGVWLDRGELDKIIERNMSYGQGTPATGGADSQYGYAPARPDWDHHDDRHDRGHHGGSRHQGGRHGGHRRGFLGGLFD
ncbi:MAG: zf-TFIIB domain-containing protein [Sphingobium sp.]|nr:MAG: recombination protein RecR [Stutzerimonas stutzeri]